MSFRRFVTNIRRRSYWQPFIIYVGTGWAVLQFIDQVQNRLSLPQWTYGAALILLLMGLPIVLATAVIQAGNSPAVEDTVPQRIFSWRNAIGGGLLAFIVGGGALVLWLNFAPSVKSSGDDDLKSVAVLPFVDMSETKDQEYFGDGITEEILNVLAQVEGLRVPARTSSFSFKGKNLPIREIAQQLNVASVLEGSIRKAGNRVRITAQLIDARNDKHLWSKTFDRDASDVFAVQDEIARAIVNALRLGIESKTGQTFVAKETGSARAHELYLQGLYYWHRRHVDELPKALELFQKATRVDPNYARAWAGTALTYALLPQYVGTYDRALAIREGKAAASRALELDPNAADAEAALGQIAQELEWNWSAAARHLDRAVELDPNYATARQWRTELFITLGRYDDAIDESNRALERDPLSLIIQHVRGFALDFSGAPERALPIYRAILEQDPTFRMTYGNVFVAAWKAEQYEGLPENALYGAITNALTDPAKRAAALRALADPTTRRTEWVGILATAYLRLGEPDSAAVMLDRAADGWQPALANFARSPNMTTIKNHPAFLSYRSKVKL